MIGRGEREIGEVGEREREQKSGGEINHRNRRLKMGRKFTEVETGGLCRGAWAPKTHWSSEAPKSAKVGCTVRVVWTLEQDREKNEVVRECWGLTRKYKRELALF